MKKVDSVSFQDFKKLDLRVATITKVEDVEEADKLYKLLIKIGGEEKTLAAGLKPFYTPSELLGKKIIVIANLEPRKVKGVESQGMLLAACAQDYSKVVVLTPDKEIEDGCSVS